MNQSRSSWKGRTSASSPRSTSAVLAWKPTCSHSWYRLFLTVPQASEQQSRITENNTISLHLALLEKFLVLTIAKDASSAQVRLPCARAGDGIPCGVSCWLFHGIVFMPLHLCRADFGCGRSLFPVFLSLFSIFLRLGITC